VSCIVPVRNGERFLGEALESIFGQTYRPIEVIVVDDSSTDATPRIVETFGRPIVYLESGGNNIPRARNVGLGAARGEFVAFLDSDDLWVPEKLARQMARFEARPELDFCVAHVQNFWMDEVADEGRRMRGTARAGPIPGYVTVALLARRRLFETVGAFDESLRHGDSMDWFLRARERGAVEELLPDVLTLRRMHARNISRRRAGESRDEFLSLLKRSLDKRRAADSGPPNA
jgi:glycosyltransferase involved in cell wall biosynthesis